MTGKKLNLDLLDEDSALQAIEEVGDLAAQNKFCMSAGLSPPNECLAVQTR